MDEKQAREISQILRAPLLPLSYSGVSQAQFESPRMQANAAPGKLVRNK